MQSFEGEGCSISMSSASMMTQVIKGKKVEEAIKAFADFFRYDARQRL